jgi:DNA-directed RNA polymerase subunit H (RpoH/RPB5)
MLDILETRGYDVDKYRKFSPDQAIASNWKTTSSSLNFTVFKKDDPDKKCEVIYANLHKGLEDMFNSVPDDETDRVEFVIMMTAQFSDAIHNTALKQYTRLKQDSDKDRRKLRVSFFNIEMIVVNPMKHVLVPKHEIIPPEQHKTLMESKYITSKSNFPQIKFHTDPIARCIGAVPGDIIKITRPSNSSGEAIIYRVCVP